MCTDGNREVFDETRGCSEERQGGRGNSRWKAKNPIEEKRKKEDALYFSLVKTAHVTGAERSIRCVPQSSKVGIALVIRLEASSCASCNMNSAWTRASFSCDFTVSCASFCICSSFSRVTLFRGNSFGLHKIGLGRASWKSMPCLGSTSEIAEESAILKRRRKWEGGGGGRGGEEEMMMRRRIRKRWEGDGGEGRRRGGDRELIE